MIAVKTNAKTARVLPDVSKQLADMAAKLADMESKNAELVAIIERGAMRGPRKLGIRMSDKTPGSIQLTGLRRIPWSFYRDELNAVIAPEFIASVRKFLTDHADELDRVQAAYVARKTGVAPTAE